MRALVFLLILWLPAQAYAQMGIRWQTPIPRPTLIGNIMFGPRGWITYGGCGPGAMGHGHGYGHCAPPAQHLYHHFPQQPQPPVDWEEIIEELVTNHSDEVKELIAASVASEQNFREIIQDILEALRDKIPSAQPMPMPTTPTQWRHQRPPTPTTRQVRDLYYRGIIPAYKRLEEAKSVLKR